MFNEEWGKVGHGVVEAVQGGVGEVVHGVGDAVVG